MGIGVEDGEAAAGVSEDQFGPWEGKPERGRGMRVEPSFALGGEKANLLTDCG